MAVPVIDTTTSVLAFVGGLTYNVQLALAAGSEAATGWSVASGGLPPGMTLNSSGKISGKIEEAAEGSVWVAQIIATNGSGNSAPLELTCGVELRAASADASVELNVDLASGRVALPSNEEDGKGRAVIYVKRGDEFPLSIGFWKNGLLVPVPVFLLKVALKEFDPERNYQIDDGALHTIGDEYAPRVVTGIDLTASALRSLLANYEADGGTSVDLLCEIEYSFYHDMGGEDPVEKVRTTRSFIMRFVRDMI